MPRRPCTFKESDVRRAIRATMAAGVIVARVEIDKDGKIVLFTTAEKPLESTDELDAELAEFEARRTYARKA